MLGARRACVALLALGGVALGNGAARADGYARLADGAPAYVELRPAVAMGLLKQLGVGELPEVKELSKQLGGLDVLDPVILTPTGLDAAAPIVGALWQPFAGPKGARWHRVVATVSAPAMLRLTLTGLAQSGRLPLQLADGALAKAGVLASLVHPADGEWPATSAILRLDGERAVIDVVQVERGQPPPPGELARRLPLQPKTRFSPTGGARGLMRPEPGVAVHLDGRRLPELLAAVLPPKERRPECERTWARAPGAFDEVTLALAAEPGRWTLEIGWARRAGGLHMRFHPVDDAGVDTALLGQLAPALVQLYAASLEPFRALERSGPLASADALERSIDRCGPAAWSSLLVRAWPQAIGALVGALGRRVPADDDTAREMLNAFTSDLRNLTVAVRDPDGERSRWVLGGTFGGQTSALAELLLSAAGGEARPLQVGKRTLQLFAAEGVSVGSESLPSGALALYAGDSDDTLGWAVRQATVLGAKPPARVTLPLAELFLDGSKLAAQLGKLGVEDPAALDTLLRRMGRADATVTSDGELFRLTLRSSLQPK